MSFDGYMQIIFSTIAPAIIALILEIKFGKEKNKKRYAVITIGLWIFVAIIATTIYFLTKPSDTVSNPVNKKSVTAFYDPNTPQTSSSGVNILVNAKTSFPAECVTVLAESCNNDNNSECYNMHGGRYEWTFVANFYIKGTYTVVVTAYDSEGNEVSDSFEYVY